jgi:hypothetical protein
MTDYLKPIFELGSSLVGLPADATDEDVAKAQAEAENFMKTIMSGVVEFFESLISIFILVAIWGWICVSMLSFTRPDSKVDNDPSKNFTNTIIGELDQLFPDDIEYAPYGFDWSRGIPQKNKIEREEKEEETNKDSNSNDDDESNTNPDESKLSKFLKYVKGDKKSAVPYKWSAREFKEGTQYGEFDTESDGSFIKNEKRYKETFMDSITEWFTNSIYFCYGNHRAIIKKLFRWLNVTMINQTPSAVEAGKEKEPDPKSEYGYTSNVMVLVYILLFLFVLIPFFGLGLGSTLMMLVGSIWNQTAKKDKSGSEKYTTETFGGKIFEGLIYTLVFGAFTIMPAAGASYFILPAIFLAKLLLYPLSTQQKRDNTVKLLSEISPTLVFIFSIGMAISANYCFPEPFSYIIIGAVFVAYSILFRDSIKRLFGFFALIQSGLVHKKNYNPNKPNKAPPAPSAPPMDA